MNDQPFKMISFEKAFETVMNSCREVNTEVVPFLHSAGRILAADVISDIDMPPFNRAAVDGYACNKMDMDSELDLTGIVRAGEEPVMKVGKNQCVKIMTGAIVPEGCDAVFMVEDSEMLPSGKVVFRGTGRKSNMSSRGEDVKAGDIVIHAGKLISPQDIAVMAFVGQTEVTVAVKPQIGIISTGDELVEPHQRPPAPKIRNSNAYQLLAQAERAGASGKYYGIAPDSEDATLNLVMSALADSDIVVLTGGVSMGDFDFVPKVLEKAGVKILFDQVNVQPGKPTTFGVHKKALVFGLPGNPVSCFVQFELLVRPLVYRMMGYSWKPVLQVMKLGERYERKSSSRMAWMPVKVSDNYEAMPVEYHGSAHLTAFLYTDGIVEIPPGKGILEKGETVTVRRI